MAETPTTRIWWGRLTFVALAITIFFVQLLPTGAKPESWTGPDMLLVLVLAFVVRRPAFVPFALLAGVLLMADLLLQRPPGLWAALVCGVSEMLRRRSRGLRNVPLLMEWGTVALSIVAIALGYRLVLILAMVPQPPLGLTLVQTVATIAVYPVVVGLAQLFFGLTRPAPGQVDSFGHKL
ncbi:rod shape-determining protein MreD [Salipiger sp. IMCC34102]|uniref:rod shape-determining protein MreD n=1 Tax=Salipiger sp. IMCC34102 TaxID=2510647 RepID=UPI00101BF25F|nr:rod shape-determining protein MreD [Salipiger sp. IMCC34102]RYH02141.1 rod shape-determining protein MreD [Salipiger sp. IMCC34102]